MLSSPFPAGEVPLKPIPGDCGLPILGPLKDRLDYFYNEGPERFFTSRIRRYNSTVFRTNMPPGPFITSSSRSRVICLLDALSFPILLDTSKVDKRNVLDGTYLPSLSFTGGYRVCAYLDPSEPLHSSLKSFVFFILASLHDKIIPLFRVCLDDLFVQLEDALATEKQAFFNDLSDEMSFNFVFRLLCENKDPSETCIGPKGNKKVDKWLLLQLAPVGALRLLPNYLEDLLLHTFNYPFVLVKSHYRTFYDAFNEYGGSLLDAAEKEFGLKRDEACHNLVFVAWFNAYGGMKILFPALIKWVGLAGEELHRQLADEIRTVVGSCGGVTVAALEKMTLTKSVVYEALRIEPPVPFQYARAREDMVVRSHEAAFEIKKGEMLFGYQPLATKDPKVFENPEEFVGDRFVGEEGEKLLKHVYWCNGRETGVPSVEDKQCPGKDVVLLLARLLLVQLFLRYDTFNLQPGTFFLQSTATIKSLKKASASLP